MPFIQRQKLHARHEHRYYQFSDWRYNSRRIIENAGKLVVGSSFRSVSSNGFITLSQLSPSSSGNLLLLHVHLRLNEIEDRG